MNAQEIFKPFRNSDYSVSNQGNVKNHKRDRLMSIFALNGYQGVSLTLGGKRKNVYVHRLVAECFLEDWDESLTVNHKDGVRINNFVSNLEMMTIAENLKHSFEVLGRKTTIKKRAVQKFDLEGNLLKTYESTAAAGRDCGIAASGITRVIWGKGNTAGGFVWKAVDLSFPKPDTEKKD